MTDLWSLPDLITATGGHLLNRFSARIAGQGVSIDSRTVQADDVFVALVGERFDGHAYVAAALSAGAAVALVSRPVGDVGPALMVADTQQALVDLARHARTRSRARIAAVTGSVGKTSTKDMLARALAASAPTHASAGNLNNHIGLPLSLARLPEDSRFAVFELGMNHPGEIAPLTHLVRPHAAIITEIAPVHLEYFTDIDAIADEKISILDALAADGCALLPVDSPSFTRLRAGALARGARIVTFGAHSSADIRLLACAPDATGSTVSAQLHGRLVTYRLSVPGAHWVANSLGVLGILDALGADIDAGLAALASMVPPKGRGLRQTLALPAGGSALLIDDSYNASPAAVRAAFAVLGQTPARRRLAFLGDMLELGPTGPQLHGELADAAVTAGIDQVYTAGALMQNLHTRLPDAHRGLHAATAADLAPIAAQAIRDGDAVLVKGSLGSRMGVVVDALSKLNTEKMSGEIH